MFKTVWLIRRNPALTREEFIDYYETTHSKFVGKTPGVRRYLRRYTTPLTGVSDTEPTQPQFDVMMELWWDDRAGYDAALAAFEPDSALGKLLQEDEARVFDRHAPDWCTILHVDPEHETDLSSPTFDSTYAPGG